KIIASSKDLSDTVTMRPTIFEYVLKGTPRFDNFRLDQPGRKLSLRVHTTPVIEDSTVSYIVQVATSLEPVQAELDKLRAILFLLIPATVLLTGIAGSVLVKVTLNPVDDMVRTIRQIKADNLRMRLPLPHAHDEIHRLAETYNQMLERLENAFTSQQRFNQDISHELKTPLTVLKGELEVTLKKSRTPEEYAEVIRSGLEEIDKIRRILDHLLLLARFDSKELAMETQPVDLNLLMEKVMAHIKILADQKSIQISYVSSGPVVLQGHEPQLRRLFINLVDNAIKYTPQKGRVIVTLSRDGDLAVTEVSDTGIGIPDNELPHIFDRFYRVEKSRSSEGFGLGLSIAKSIAQAHQGDIKVRSHPGLGTTFTVFLPVKPPLS
ncbi:MAG TPA: ATP-binding protein, partial [Candidatus Eisenbacteria bacterium]|nr:ATP-binding protein [Candidatus Eisenbacteria bacterium]